jgi:hypothetical protein
MDVAETCVGCIMFTLVSITPLLLVEQSQAKGKAREKKGKSRRVLLPFPDSHEAIILVPVVLDFQSLYSALRGATTCPTSAVPNSVLVHLDVRCQGPTPCHALTTALAMVLALALT